MFLHNKRIHTHTNNILNYNTKTSTDRIKTLRKILPDKIKFTYNISEIECTFLDVTIYKYKLSNDTLITLATKLYLKPIIKYLFIPFFSNHSPYVYKG